MVSSFFGAKFGKHIEELLVSPLPNWVIVLGYVSRRRAARHCWSGSWSRWSRCSSRTCTSSTRCIVIAAVLLTSVVFSLGGFINAMFAKNFDQISFSRRSCSRR